MYICVLMYTSIPFSDPAILPVLHKEPGAEARHLRWPRSEDGLRGQGKGSQGSQKGLLGTIRGYWGLIRSCWVALSPLALALMAYMTYIDLIIYQMYMVHIYI